jgi:glycine cleavage system H protein
MVEIREDRLYAPTHEWVLVNNDVATCGISDHAQAQLGELVFVELPEVGDEVTAGDDICVLESVKSASDVYAPLSGTVIEVNTQLENTLSLIHQSPYDDGWLYKIRLHEEKCNQDLKELLSTKDYEKNITE